MAPTEGRVAKSERRWDCRGTQNYQVFTTQYRQTGEDEPITNKHNNSSRGWMDVTSHYKK